MSIQRASPKTTRTAASPLKIYARATELEEHCADDGHYALFETPERSFAAARAYADELLLRHLPPPCRLLKIGVGAGVTLASLVARGYSASAVTADAAELAHARARHGTILPASCVDLHDFSVQAGAWDALLFHDTAQCFDLLDLLTESARLLGEHGELIVVDEFARERAKPGVEKPHLLAHFIGIAGRLGFTVVEQLDLTTQALPTIEYRMRVVSRQAKALQRETGATSEEIAVIGAAERAKHAEFAKGRFGYFLVKLRRTARPRWRVGRVDHRHATAVRSLFAEIFGHSMSEAHWQWKYGGERGAAVGVWDDKRLIAHYGGVARRIVFFGEDQSAAQSCDVMVAPTGRTTLSRQGPLFLAASTYLETQLGYGNPHLLGVGFPNVRAWKAPQRLGLYAGPVGHMVELSWTASRGWPSRAVTLQMLDLEDAQGGRDADACWAAMRADVDRMIVGVRDARALRHRYGAHPDKTYLIVLARRRFSGAPLGLFVLNPEAAEGCELMDVVAPLAQIPQLVSHARRTAARIGAKRLFAWAVDNIQSFFGEADVRELDINVPANAWTAGPPIEMLIGKWWLTGGDTDFR